MAHTHMTLAIVEWERRLAIEAEQRQSRRGQPWANLWANIQPCRPGPASIFTRLFHTRQARQSGASQALSQAQSRCSGAR